MKNEFLDIDLDGESRKMIPYSQRQSISFLLGAGFSVPKGYPCGKTLNENLLNFSDPVSFSPAGVLSIPKTGLKSDSGYCNNYEKSFNFCLELIRYYNEKNKDFDYEKFYDFIVDKDLWTDDYKHLALKWKSSDLDFHQLMYSLSPIYNQMVEYLIKKDISGSDHEDESCLKFKCEGYDGFLDFLEELAQTNVVNVHTLNHDLFFESLNGYQQIGGTISDGFDEYGSNYYGKLNKGDVVYTCRLKRYTGYYNTPIRLYKLHGSFNYALYYRTKGSFSVPDKYVKLPYGINPSSLLRALGSKKRYEKFPFTYHADFLIGTTSKILRYKEPVLYKKLFRNFKQNLRNAEKLIIIGYGAKDLGINEIISNYFDYEKKKIYIVDPFANVNSTVNEFATRFGATIITEEIDKINRDMFL